jgi:hypothetical protein
MHHKRILRQFRRRKRSSNIFDGSTLILRMVHPALHHLEVSPLLPS